MLKMKTLSQLRLAGLLEGLSLLLLLGVAMPLKHVLGMALAVKLAGSLHGLLFLWFCSVLLRAHVERRWGWRMSLGLVARAVLPFGFVLLDRVVERGVPAKDVYPESV
jgi:integral membrane protein